MISRFPCRLRYSDLFSGPDRQLRPFGPGGNFWMGTAVLALSLRPFIDVKQTTLETFRLRGSANSTTEGELTRACGGPTADLWQEASANGEGASLTEESQLVTRHSPAAADVHSIVWSGCREVPSQPRRIPRKHSTCSPRPSAPRGDCSSCAPTHPACLPALQF
jgi:hypothetical protein